MELKVSGSMELLDGPRAVWLAVLGPVSSILVLEPVRGGREVVSLKLWHHSGICHPTWGRQTLAKLP